MIIKKYFGYFILVYLTAILLVAVISMLLNVPGSSTAIAALFGAGAATAAKFVQDQHRLPSPTEKNQLIWGCLGISMLISLLICASLFGIAEERETILNMLESLPVGIWLIVLLVSLAIQYTVLALCFGWLIKITLNAKKQVK